MSLEVATLRATAHPVRLRILSLLSGTSMSAAEIARELGITQANASYHVRVLVTADLLVETGSANVRGGVAKLYTHPWREQGPKNDRDGVNAMIAVMADELNRRVTERAGTGRQALVDAELWVSPEAWLEVVDLALRASDLLHSSAQRPRSDGTVHVNMTAALFTMGADAGSGEAADADA